MSDGAVELISDTQFLGVGIARTSVLSSVLAEFGLFFSGAPFILKGWNDRQPDRMADRLGQRMNYGVEVTAVRGTGPGLRSPPSAVNALKRTRPIGRSVRCRSVY